MSRVFVGLVMAPLFQDDNVQPDSAKVAAAATSPATDNDHICLQFKVASCLVGFDNACRHGVDSSELEPVDETRVESPCKSKYVSRADACPSGAGTSGTDRLASI